MFQGYLSYVNREDRRAGVGQHIRGSSLRTSFSAPITINVAGQEGGLRPRLRPDPTLQERGMDEMLSPSFFISLRITASMPGHCED